MYNGCHNDIRLSIDYTNIQILHVVKHNSKHDKRRMRAQKQSSVKSVVLDAHNFGQGVAN